MATFFERLGAYLIDIFIVSLFLMIIGVNYSVDDSIYSDKVSELEDKLINGDITNKEYLSTYGELLYDMNSDTKVYLIISLAVNVAYFVVFQGMFHGQTIGKKLLKIKVVDEERKDSASIFQIFIRSLFTMSIISGILNIVLLYFASRNVYGIINSTLSIIETLFVLAVVICIVYRKDKRGLHDMMAGTSVIKEG